MYILYITIYNVCIWIVYIYMYCMHEETWTNHSILVLSCPFLVTAHFLTSHIPILAIGLGGCSNTYQGWIGRELPLTCLCQKANLVGLEGWHMWHEKPHLKQQKTTENEASVTVKFRYNLGIPGAFPPLGCLKQSQMLIRTYQYQAPAKILLFQEVDQDQPRSGANRGPTCRCLQLRSWFKMVKHFQLRMHKIRCVPRFRCD